MIYQTLQELDDKLDWEGDLYVLEEVLPDDIPNVRVATALERAQSAWEAFRNVFGEEFEKEVRDAVR